MRIRALNVLLTVCMLAAGSWAQAGIILDNTNDAEYQNLANQSQFDAVGVVKRPNLAQTAIVV
ncbi:MAG: hypothetical protein ACU83V_07550, partial [Gammaproteobacteria bacterium]